MAETLPRKGAKKSKPTRHGTCFWVARDDGAVLLRRRPEQGLLGGMMEVPSTEWTETKTEDPVRSAPLTAAWTPLKQRVNHTFTHFHLELEILRSEAVPNSQHLPGEDFRWVSPQDLPDEALPSVMRKVCAAVLS